MKFGIICGSQRKNSQSLKVAKHIEIITLMNDFSDKAWILNLAENPLPLWDEGVWNNDKKWEDILDPISEQLDECEAFIIIAPEYHGQVSAALKNFFQLWTNELSHKPALIVGVSSGDGGAYPVAELRMSSYKNNRICYMPEHIIIRNVESVLNEYIDGNPDENPNTKKADKHADASKYYSDRINWALSHLEEYAIALRNVRESGVTESDEFTNGM